jgi:hypothetical protein
MWVFVTLSLMGGFLNRGYFIRGHHKGERVRMHAERPRMVGCMTVPFCHRSSVVERILGKDEVTGSNPVGGFGNDALL